MKTSKTILRKINEWEGDPMMVAGMYRLFTYLPWSLVPEKYKSFFPEDAKDIWDTDLENYNKDQLKQDIESEVRAILNVLAKKNVTHAMGLIPMILADAYIIDIKTVKLKAKLIKIINAYKLNMDIDIELAEMASMFELFDLIRDIIKAADIKLSFDLEQAISQVLEAAMKLQLNTETPVITKNIDAQVDQALAEYKNKVGSE